MPVVTPGVTRISAAVIRHGRGRGRGQRSTGADHDQCDGERNAAYVPISFGHDRAP
jgi:hypothetical protein